MQNIQKISRVLSHGPPYEEKEVFWELTEWKQVEVIENPHGDTRTLQELAKATRLLAEDDKWKPKMDYRAIPTDRKKLRTILNSDKDKYI